MTEILDSHIDAVIVGWHKMGCVPEQISVGMDIRYSRVIDCLIRKNLITY